MEQQPVRLDCARARALAQRSVLARLRHVAQRPPYSLWAAVVSGERADGARVRSGGRWRLARQLAAVAAGLAPFALGVVLTLLSGLGNGPWQVLSDGLTRRLPLSFGLATTLVGLIVVLIALGLGIRPALGTLLNMTLVGAYADLILATRLLPDLRGAGWSLPETAARLALMAAGVVLVGLGTALYLKAGLGAGPRDGLMLGLSARLRRPVALVRTGIEVAVLALGVWLGGTAGLGTLLWALSIGPAVGVWFRVLGIAPPAARPARSEPPVAA